MATVIPNTRPEDPRVALFGMLDDGSFAAEVLPETSVPYTRRWDNAIDQVVVYLEPDREQLDEVLAALNEGRLDFSKLQEFGSAAGGHSTLPI